MHSTACLLSSHPEGTDMTGLMRPISGAHHSTGPAHCQRQDSFPSSPTGQPPPAYCLAAWHSPAESLMIKQSHVSHVGWHIAYVKAKPSRLQQAA